MILSDDFYSAAVLFDEEVSASDPNAALLLKLCAITEEKDYGKYY